MTQEGFFSVHREIAEISSTMVTKTEFKEELTHIWDELRAIRKEMATKEDLHNFARSWAAEVVELQETVKELQARVAALEGKKGRRG